jgi:hypothetical protein
MKKFQYEITLHPAAEFNQVAYFCNESGQCNLEEVPQNQIDVLKSMLNDQGREGWNLVQLSFGKDGLMAFWKRKIKKD